MKAGRKPQILTEAETFIMNVLWENGPQFVREILEHYPDPKPHFNTVSTTVRILENKGHVAHETIGASHRFYATAKKEDFRDRSLAAVIKNYFGNSYRNVVSVLAEEEKISADELREIIDLIESKKIMPKFASPQIYNDYEADIYHNKFSLRSTFGTLSDRKSRHHQGSPPQRGGGER